MKRQIYFLDVVMYLVIAGVVAFLVPPGPRFYAGIAMSAVCFGLWILARVQLGGSFTVTAQARTLVTTGLYSKFRNPVYLFSTLAYVGLVIAWGQPPAFGFLLFMIPMQVLRARREAAVLEQAFGDEYRAYKTRTIF